MSWRCSLGAALIICIAAVPVFGQSQAINGTIEGIVKDTSGAVLPGVTVTVTNTDTGAERVLVTNASGSYRAPLLPLGPYRIVFELSGFRTFERTGVTLSAGQTAVVNSTMEVGALEETITVTGESAIAEPGRINLGRTIGEVEIRNLPLVARNPYNFALLQPNVTGFENAEFGATRMNANGTQMRTNYQMDGSNTTQKNRAGLRMFQPSEVMIKEVQVITAGFAPEFGQTTGMVYNAITPSGTNAIRGSASYRFRRKGFSSRPFNLQAGRDKPDTKIDNVTASLGGPIKRDRWHYYFGYEYLRRDLSQDNINTITPENGAALGLTANQLRDGSRIAKANMFIAKTDAQLSPAHRLSGRWTLFLQDIPNTGGGGQGTREVTELFQDRMDSFQVQLISTLGSDKLNELRVAYNRRDNPRRYEAESGTLWVGVSVSGAASFGGGGQVDSPTDFIEDVWQIVDSFSWLRGDHAFKMGFDFQHVYDYRRSGGLYGSYSFPTIDAYLRARDGVNPYGYTTFSQNIGDPTIEYSQDQFAAYFQDDWQFSERVKLLYGLRYDLFKVPAGDPSAPYEATHSFRVDKNNLAPRVGVTWSLDQSAKTVLRASTGMMYEPPLGAFYESALQNNGAQKLLTARLSPASVGAPAFPNELDSLPPGVVPSSSIAAVDPDFNVQYTWLTNIQLERELTPDLAASFGYVNSTGRDLAVRLNQNVIPTSATLPDGRPIYSRTVNASTRLDPRFDGIDYIRSTGTSQYNAVTFSINKRQAHGLQAQASYTIAKALDDGVIGGTYVVGSGDRPGLSDPSNQKRDYNYTSWNVTHSIVASTVWMPEVSGDGAWAAVMRDNQFSVVLLANSGLPFNIRSNRDLNLDGTTADRPNDIPRNSGHLGWRVNFDGRYSRFIRFGADRRLEVFFEAKNLFNKANTSGVNTVVATDLQGNPLSAIPADEDFPITGYYQSRQLQIGFKFTF